MEYKWNREGDNIKVEIFDYSGRRIYKTIFPIKDKNSWNSFLFQMQKFGVPLVELIKRILDDGWF